MRRMLPPQSIPASSPGDRGERQADAMAASLVGRPADAATSPAELALPSQRLAVPPGWERALAESAPSGRPLGDGAGPGLAAAARGLRIHADERADELCRDVGASAFTYGKDIYFARGRFQPGTTAGRELLAHEVAHAILPRPFAFVQRQPNPAPPTPPGPLDYDRSVGSLPMPKPGTTAAQVTQALDDNVTKGKIRSYAPPKGTVAGSAAEVFLLWTLLLLGERARWGTELDILTAIGWPAKAGDPTPQGQVTVRIDRNGAATAELIAAGPLPAVAPTTLVDGAKRLRNDFGFASVTGWGNTRRTRPRSARCSPRSSSSRHGRRRISRP